MAAWVFISLAGFIFHILDIRGYSFCIEFSYYYSGWKNFKRHAIGGDGKSERAKEYEVTTQILLKKIEDYH